MNLPCFPLLVAIVLFALDKSASQPVNQLEATIAEMNSLGDWKRDVFNTDEEARDFVRLIQHFALAKDVDSLVQLRTWYMNTLFATRMKRCIRLLHSRGVCENNVGFYIWAQLLAKDIMSGKFPEN